MTWLTQEGEVWRARFRPSAHSRVMMGLGWVFWTVGWLAGVVVPGAALGRLVLALLRSVPLAVQAPQGFTSSWGAVLAVLFLALWLLVWVPVGLVAQVGLLWAIFVREEVTVDPGGVTRRSIVGPWGRSTRVAFCELSDVSLRRESHAVMGLRHTGEEVALSQGGTAEQHQVLWARMRELTGLGGPVSELKHVVPMGKEVAPVDGGVWVLPARTTRVRWAWALGVLGLVLLLSMLLLAWRQLFDGTSVVALFVLGVLGVLAAWLLRFSGWTLRGVNAWEVRPGALVRRSRGLGRIHAVRYPVEWLEVTRRRQDSEDGGDVVFALWLRSAEGSFELMRDTVDRRPVEHLGHWLAHRLDVPLRLKGVGEGWEELVTRRLDA
ncbi:hypothetical protein MFUL124B02_34020 [Myxococcus fulvus 124B02]|nr:hypothetical protein MFUL124B02_34020 [Myxococcus fulvus 124B02]